MSEHRLLFLHPICAQREVLLETARWSLAKLAFSLRIPSLVRSGRNSTNYDISGRTLRYVVFRLEKSGLADMHRSETACIQCGSEVRDSDGIKVSPAGINTARWPEEISEAQFLSSQRRAAT